MRFERGYKERSTRMLFYVTGKETEYTMHVILNTYNTESAMTPTWMDVTEPFGGYTPSRAHAYKL